MTRRPRTVSGTAGGPGLMAMDLVPTVLLADADVAACAMVRDALLEGVGPTDLKTVASTAELEQHLTAAAEHPPALILVDAELPGSERLEAVRAMKSNPELRRTPVVVLARAPEPGLVAAAYDAGANTVIRKPVTFLALVKLMKVFTAYWLDAATLPQDVA